MTLVIGPDGREAPLLVDVSGNLKTAGGGIGGGGDASAAKQDQQTAELQAIKGFVDGLEAAMTALNASADDIESATEAVAAIIAAGKLSVADAVLDGTVSAGRVLTTEASAAAIKTATEAVAALVSAGRLLVAEQNSAAILARLPSATNSAAAALPANFDSLAETYGYTGDNVTTIVKTNGVNTWTQTLGYTGANLTSASGWVQT